MQNNVWFSGLDPNGLEETLKQWLSTFFVLVHTFQFARKPVHPYHALKSTTAKVQNFYAVDVA